MTGTPSVPRPDGRIVAIDAGHQAVCFYRHYPQPVAAVWRHLSRPALLRRWLAAAGRLDPAEGGAVVLRWLATDPDGLTVIASGAVTAYDPPTLLELDLDAARALVSGSADAELFLYSRDQHLFADSSFLDAR
ncbi:SRPBCC domain-containing protein [Kitasatospora sp. NPDC059811]|uniref:SRPBCC family protein n=1 Tax=unclassified Kitasatospora TaxID=2633591 RepID=UPI0007AF65B2